jgi:hypothetical protein
MYYTGGPYDFVYVHTEIPEGMTIREWRAQRATERAQHHAGHCRGRLRLRQGLTAVGRRWRAPRGIVWRSEVRHSSGAHGSISS